MTNLTQSEFDSIAPYSFSLSKDGRIVHCGPSLAEVIPHVGDQRFEDVFETVEGGPAFDPTALEGPPTLHSLRLRSSGMVIEGRFWPRSGGRIFVASCVPALKTPGQRYASPAAATADASVLRGQVFSDHASHPGTRGNAVASATQNDLVSIVSHEFRTPLTAIDGSLFLLRRHLSTPGVVSDSHFAAADRWLSLMSTAVGNLKQLVDQVLTYSRMERLGREDGFTEQSPAKLVRDLLQELNISPDFRVDLRDNLPMNYYSFIDALVVRAAISNLVSNALKYSPLNTRVVLTLDRVKEGWRVAVEDKGRGIPLDDQAHLFEPFFRAKNVGSLPGTGLGLAIVQRAVAFHGGELTFTSRQDVGTRFELTFPTVPRCSGRNQSSNPFFKHDAP